MTIRKQYTARAYDTFPEAAPSDAAGQLNESPTSYHQGDSDKSRSAAAEAQRLASTGSWADRFSGGTPATNMTPTASTVDGDEEDVQGVHYPPLPHEADPSDPPPLYTPSASTVSPSAPSSPVATRVAPVSEPVSAPVTVTSSLRPSPSGSQPQAQQESFSPYTDNDDEEEDRSTCSLPEPVQHPYQHHPNEAPSVPVSTNARPNNCSRRRWCMSRRSRSRGCGHGHWDRKHRARRFKRTCWFIFALLACLWLMLPGLCKSLADKGHTQLPNVGSEPTGQFPIPNKREYRQHETSHSISGTHQLYDLLDLSTTSGSIVITVDVQSGDKPAVLRLSTTSGSVHVRMAPTSSGGKWFGWQKSKENTSGDKVKNSGRVFKTEISTNSGAVTGNILHGNGGSTSISTHSGSIQISVYSVGVSEDDPLSSLTTSTRSGSQGINVFGSSPIQDIPLPANAAIRAIKATHTTTGSGSMNIKYPSEWEGRLHVLARGSGSISAGGNGLQVQRQGRHELFGWRGDDAEHGQILEVTEMGSGSVNFQC